MIPKPAMSPSSNAPVSRIIEELDTIPAVLPIERRDELAELLTDQDVVTLRHLVNEGMGENTLRALTSDLAYLQAWSLAAMGRSLPWPAPEAFLLKFVAHHLWDPEKSMTDPDHGTPKAVEHKLRIKGFLRSSGPHAPDTVRRRLSTWSTLTKWRGLNGTFDSPAPKSAFRLAVRATPRPRKRKSAKAVTRYVLSNACSCVPHQQSARRSRSSATLGRFCVWRLAAVVAAKWPDCARSNFQPSHRSL
jgi:hypothetical protein